MGHTLRSEPALSILILPFPSRDLPLSYLSCKPCRPSHQRSMHPHGSSCVFASHYKRNRTEQEGYVSKERQKEKAKPMASMQNPFLSFSVYLRVGPHVVDAVKLTKLGKPGAHRLTELLSALEAFTPTFTKGPWINHLGTPRGAFSNSPMHLPLEQMARLNEKIHEQKKKEK